MMRALLIGNLLAAASPALADPTYTVDKVTITGNKSVPTAKLMEAVQSHKGSRVTQGDIVADQDAISKVLGAANVVGGIQTSMVSKPGNHIEIIFAVKDEGVQAPEVTKVTPKLRAETFEGNASISTDKLEAASGLRAGEDLTNDKMAAAQKAILAVYTAAKLPVSVAVSFSDTKVSSTELAVVWHIVETKAKKKPPTTE